MEKATKSFEAFYTPLLYKQKKRKSWQEGKLVLFLDRNRAVLYGDQDMKIDSAYTSLDKICEDAELDLDRHVILVGPEISCCKQPDPEPKQKSPIKCRPISKKKSAFKAPRIVSKDSNVTCNVTSNENLDLVGPDIVKNQSRPDQKVNAKKIQSEIIESKAPSLGTRSRWAAWKEREDCPVERTDTADSPAVPASQNGEVVIKTGVLETKRETRQSFDFLHPGSQKLKLRFNEIPEIKDYLFYVPPDSLSSIKQNEIKRKFARKMLVPTSFDSVEQYSTVFRRSILEHLQLLLYSHSAKLSTLVARKGDLKGRSFERYLSSKRIALYSSCKLAMFEPRDATLRYSSAERFQMLQDTFILHLSRKEASSAYSKDDLWVVAPSLDELIHGGNTLLAKSTFYGPQSQLELELCPFSAIDKQNLCKWTDKSAINFNDMYAIRLFNIGTEALTLDLLDPDELARVPILKNSLLGGYSALHVEPEAVSGAKRANSSEIAAVSALESQQDSAESVVDSSNSVEAARLMRLDDVEPFLQYVEQSIEQFRLNSDQAELVRKVASSIAYGRSAVTLCHGVFGSGKSFLAAVLIIVLVESASLFRFELGTIVVASMSNVAVDRIMLNLLDQGFTGLKRVGSIKKINKQVLPYLLKASSQSVLRDQIKDLQDMLKLDKLGESDRQAVQLSLKRLKSDSETFGGFSVIGTTCAACSFDVLANVKSSLLILDECSQMTEPLSLIPIARFKPANLLLIGDPLQLAPTVTTPLTHTAAGGHGLEWTLFERLFRLRTAERVLLKTQYRCHPAISSVANACFYGGQLLDGTSTVDRTFANSKYPPLSFVDIPAGSELASATSSFYNHAEAQVALNLSLHLLKLYDGVLSSDEIGIVCLYKGQAEYIHEMIERQTDVDDRAYLLQDLAVSTVDAFQGAEKKVIILSTVRTSTIGFMDEPRRVNVAITRARNHLFVLGRQSLLLSNPLWGRILGQLTKVSASSVDSSAASRFDLQPTGSESAPSSRCKSPKQDSSARNVSENIKASGLRDCSNVPLKSDSTCDKAAFGNEDSDCLEIQDFSFI